MAGIKRTAEDIRFSKAVRERDNFTCQRCGKQHERNSMGLHCMHNHTRRIKATRHMMTNALSGCYGCHQFIDSHPDEKERLFRLRFGNEEYDRVAAIAHGKEGQSVMEPIQDDRRTERVGRYANGANEKWTQTVEQYLKGEWTVEPIQDDIEMLYQAIGTNPILRGRIDRLVAERDRLQRVVDAAKKVSLPPGMRGPGDEERKARFIDLWHALEALEKETK